MNKRDYTALDAAIHNAIAKGCDTFRKLVENAAIADLARPHETPLSAHDRVIDRRLQALRKRGSIKFVGVKWRVE